MATQIRDGYLLPQVWVTKNATKVLEILGRLTPARVEYAENIFGGERYLSKNAEKIPQIKKALFKKRLFFRKNQ